MSKIQSLGDKLSISLSMLCVVHCLAMPVLFVVLPTISALPLAGEEFHLFLAAVVIPLSTLTLFMGCRHHRTWRVVIVGVFGLLALGATALFGHDILGESGEKIATVLAASIIAIAHFWNYKLCSSEKEVSCGCTEID